MTFWMIIFALVVLAMAGLVLPLLRPPKAAADVEHTGQNIQIAREQLAELEHQNTAGELDISAYETRKQELESALLADLQSDTTPPAARKTVSPSLTAAVVGVFVPVAAFGLYAWLGTPDALQASSNPTVQDMPPDHPPLTGNPQAPDIGKMVEGLRKKLDDKPDNPDGWNMLGRSYMNMERFSDAAYAYRKLHDLKPDDAGILLLLADALAMSNDGKVQGEAEQLALQALAKEPNNVTALWLSGLAASERNDKAKALEYWHKLLPLLDDSPEEQAEVQGLVKALEYKKP